MYALEDGFNVSIVKIKGKWCFLPYGENTKFSSYRAANVARMEIYKQNPVRGALIDIVKI